MAGPCLNTMDISDENTIILRNKLNALHKISGTLILNDESENFVKAHMEAVAECIPTQLRVRHRVLWETLTV